MKKIVILHQAHYEQIYGGAELQISYLAKHLNSIGFTVYYIYEDIGKVILNLDGLVLCPIKYKKSISALGRKWIIYKSNIIKCLDDIKPDYIYTRLGSSWMGIASIYAKRNKIPHVHAVASDRDVNVKVVIKDLLHPFNLIDYLYLYIGFRNVKKLIIQNYYQDEIIRKRFNKCGILINQMTEYVSANTIKKQSSPIQIIWIGNLKQIKRPDLFIKLAGAIGDIGVDYKLIMVGRCHPQYKELLNSEIKKNPHFKFLGELSQEDVNSLILKSHILVNTSEFEGFSNTFLQAWIRKVPVISMKSNPNQILTNNEIGIIAESFDNLVNCVRVLTINTSLREGMGEKAYDYTVHNHLIENNIEKIVSVIQVE